ncbi:RNA-directed DNA polymerase, eukaryota, reverse transcriptase zinc-binding domain protein [Tanacetum coccineum]
MRNKFFIGGDQDEKKMTWVKRKKCLASKKHRGLGIGSIFGLNIGLLFKWIWRFLSRPCDLWARVIQCVYGSSGGIFDGIARRSSFSSWGTILSSISNLKQNGIDLISFCTRKIRNVSPLVFGLASCSWKWSIDGSGGFSVASVRSLVDHHTFDMDQEVTRWNSFIPIKVNVFLWRLKLNKLPSRVNLDRKGIELDSMLCPICHGDVVTLNHIFFNCDTAKDLWSLLASWWDLDIPMCANIMDWFDWLDSLHISNRARAFLEGVGGPSYGSYGTIVITCYSLVLILRRRCYGILLFRYLFMDFL